MHPFRQNFPQSADEVFDHLTFAQWSFVQTAFAVKQAINLTSKIDFLSLFDNFWTFAQFHHNCPLFCPTPNLCRARLSSSHDPHARLSLYKWSDFNLLTQFENWFAGQVFYSLDGGAFSLLRTSFWSKMARLCRVKNCLFYAACFMGTLFFRM